MTTRRSFLKGLAALLTAITAPLTLKGKAKESKASEQPHIEPIRHFYIDNKEVTAEQFDDYENYPHIHCRSIRSGWYSMDNRWCQSSISHPAGVKPYKKYSSIS